MRSLFIVTAFLVAYLCILVSSLPYTKDSPVISLTDANFVGTVIGEQKVTVVEFYAPWCGHCKSLAPQYEKAAENLKGIVQVAAIDCDKYKGAAQEFGIKGFPTIKVFGGELTPDPKSKEGGLSKKPTDYNGPRTAKGIIDFALTFLHDKFIQKLSPKNIQNFLNFNASKLSPEGAPRVILFTNKKDSSNLYKSLSIEYRGRAVFGEVRQNEKALLETYNITSFPRIIVLTSNQTDPTPFDQTINYDNLHSFVESHALPSLLKVKEKPNSGKEGNKKAPTPTPAAPEKPQLVELVKQADLEKNCLEKKDRMCVLTFLPSNNSDPQGLEGYLKVLNGLVSGDKGPSFRWSWVDGELYSTFKESFCPAADLPRLVVFSAARQRIYRYTASFTASNIETFLGRILTGKVSPNTLDKVPSLPAEPLPKPSPVPIVEEDEADE